MRIGGAATTEVSSYSVFWVLCMKRLLGKLAIKVLYLSVLTVG